MTESVKLQDPKDITQTINGALADLKDLKISIRKLPKHTALDVFSRIQDIERILFATLFEGDIND